MLLGLDLGTTNVKAAVMDLAGQVLGQGSAPVRLLPGAKGDVEQDLEEIWSAALAAVRQATPAANGSAIQALGVSSQGGALQMLDRQHRPFGRVISWLDGRGAADDQRLTHELGRAWFKDHICHGGSGLAIGQLLRLRREQPAALEPPNRVGFVGDEIVARLCGRPAHDGTSAALTLLYNPALRDYDPDLLRRLGLSPAQLPALVSPPSAAGGLLPEAARQMGLQAGIPVSPAIHDQYASALGSAAVQAGDVMFGTGTAWVLLALMDRLREPVTEETFVCHHVVPDLYGQIISMRNGGSSFAWALQLLGLEKLSGAEIDARLRSVPPGSDRLAFRPLLGAFDVVGVAPGTRGRLDGLQLSHTPAHVLRSVAEGLALELNRHLDLLRKADLPVQRLLMTGGAAASEVTPQIVADVTGLPVVCQGGLPSSLRGAVILARSMLPGQGALRGLTETMALPGRPFQPGPDAPFYRRQFETYLRSLPSAAAELARS
jgi:xylulokinase